MNPLEHRNVSRGARGANWVRPRQSHDANVPERVRAQAVAPVIFCFTSVTRLIFSAEQNV